VKIALLQEVARPLPTGADLAPILKALTLPHAGPRPMDEAISTAGGVPRAALTDALMLRDWPGVFCAGEMLDWEAPTGGYLITGCLATGPGPGDTPRFGLDFCTSQPVHTLYTPRAYAIGAGMKAQKTKNGAPVPRRPSPGQRPGGRASG
jgi:hypothetical protein